MGLKGIEIAEAIESLANLSSNLQDLWWLLLLIVVIVAGIAAVILFCLRTHKVTLKTISGLKKNKKYIPKVFVELNECKEVLRYFVYGPAWKERIIKEFNDIYHNYYGEILKHAVNKNDCVFHLSAFEKMSSILSAIQGKKKLHNSLKNRQYDFVEDYSESQALFEICVYPYDKALTKLEKYTKSSMSRYLVMTGSAGNGKTNLLCSISELIMNLEHAVIFITAREIKDNPERYILDHLQVPQFIKNYPKAYWKIVNLLLFFRRRYCFIIVDAINENEEEDFSKKLSLFINEMLTYTRFKVIVSCRNEYYQSRFRENLVENISVPGFELDIKDEDYNKKALERIFVVYKNYFKFEGRVSLAVKEILYDQLLLLRIFFETYANSNVDVLSICKHEVFKEYINHVALTTSSDTDKFLRKLARIMLDNEQYDGIPISAIENIPLDVDVIKKTIDDSILISKKIVTNEGTIAELENEVIYFVFDEMRDYVLAREIVLANTDSEGRINLKSILNNIFYLKERGSSPLEGVIHYTYVLFRTEKNWADLRSSNELRTKLLNLVKFPGDRRKNDLYCGRRHRVEFKNLGLRIILTSGLSIEEVEKDYIRTCLINDPCEDGGIVFDAMLKGTMVGGVYNLDTYLDIIFGIHDKECMIKALMAIKVRKFYYDYYMPDNIENIHRSLYLNDSASAEQIQRVAELFLLCFNIEDTDEHYSLKNYFDNLPNHQEIHNQMIEKIKVALR